jgi:hypothetical protein
MLSLGINKGLAKGGTPAFGVPDLFYDALCKKKVLRGTIDQFDR